MGMDTFNDSKTNIFQEKIIKVCFESAFHQNPNVK